MFSNLRGPALVWTITLSTASCFLLFGYDQGVLGGLVSQPSFLNAIGNPSAGFLGTIVALYDIGCVLGCFVAGLWGNKMGRKLTIIVGNGIMVVGAIIQCSCHGPAQLIVGRIISGIGNGMNTSTIPPYVAETARSNKRGAGVATQLSIVIFGIVIAYWVDYGTTRNLTGEVVWRFPIALQIIFALITLATLPFLPDTPRWLYAHGRKAEAVQVLARLMDTSEDDPEVKMIESEMEEAVRIEEEQGQLSLKTLLNDKSDLKKTRRLVLCFMIYFLQMFTGINVIVFYCTILLETNLGFSTQTSSLIAGCIQVAFWLGTLPPIVIIDKYGRRPTMLIGSVILALCMILFTIGIAVNTPASLNLALAMLFIYQFFFGVCWNVVPWLYAAEISTLDMRHIGSAVGAFSEWIWTFVIAEMTPAAVENTGWKIYLLFCITLSLSIPFVYFFLPETNGKTLEEIDYIFAKGEARERLVHRFEDNVMKARRKDEESPAESQQIVEPKE